jgi:hypothetical protein
MTREKDGCGTELFLVSARVLPQAAGAALGSAFSRVARDLIEARRTAALIASAGWTRRERVEFQTVKPVVR